jgi:quercetin dioxygenase-like cupin family protein
MAHKGQILKDNVDGTIVEFLETSADTGGKHFKVKLTVTKKGILAPDHFHELQDEEFEVVSGTLTYKRGKELFKAKAGEKVFMQKGEHHNHYNDDDEPAVFIQTISPAHDLENFFHTLVGLSNDGKLNNGQPSLLQAMMWVNYLKGKTYLSDIPIPVQKVLAGTLGPIGRMMGYRASYPKYGGVEI